MATCIVQTCVVHAKLATHICTLEEILNFLGNKILWNVQESSHFLFMAWTFPTPGNLDISWNSKGQNFGHISWARTHEISDTFPVTRTHISFTMKILKSRTGHILGTFLYTGNSVCLSHFLNTGQMGIMWSKNRYVHGWHFLRVSCNRLIYAM